MKLTRIKEFKDNVRNYSGLRLISIVCSDHISHFEIVYYFDKNSEIMPVVTTISRRKPVTHSISDIFEVAETYEREIHEMYGILFSGNRGMKKHLLLAGNGRNKNPMRRKK